MLMYLIKVRSSTNNNNNMRFKFMVFIDIIIKAIADVISTCKG